MSEEQNSTTLKKKVLKALHSGLEVTEEKEPQASMVAQAINYLKAFPPEKEPGDPGQLSPRLAELAAKQGFTHTPLTKQ